MDRQTTGQSKRGFADDFLSCWQQRFFRCRHWLCWFANDLLSCWRQLPDKALFFALLAAWLALFQFLGNSTFGYVDTASLFKWMSAAYDSAGADAHGPFVAPVVLALFWWKRRELLAQPLRAWWPGFLIMAAGLALHVAGYMVQQPRVSVLGFVTGIYGLMGMVWGPGWLRASWFPFFLMVFLVPLGSVSEPITFRLRLVVTKIVAFVCQHGLAIDLVSDGTRLLRMPWGYEYEVAAACSGIRSLLAVAGVAVIYAFTVFKSPGKRMILLASALPLAVIGNVFRLMAIVLAAEWRGQDAGLAVHDSAFWSLLPYVPALLGLGLLGRWLEGREQNRRTDSGEVKG